MSRKSTDLSTAVVIQLNKGDILGHEFCGIVDEVGPAVKKVQKGKRYVASFQIACGECFFCKQKLSSQCEKTNANKTAKAMYGSGTAGIFGYSHFTGGFAGGQAEYVRVPLGDVNLLEIPDDVPDEKGKLMWICSRYQLLIFTSVISFRCSCHILQLRPRHGRL
jgi:threonine dehydrogenase-like Zn-dependent dehydrogenase